MLKMVDGTGIIGLDMICPLGVSTPQPPNYDRVELESTGMLVLPNSLDAPLERLELSGKTEQVTTTGAQLITLANRTDVGDTELGGKKWLTKISEQAYSVWNNYQKATVEFLENNSFKLSHAGGSSANGNGLELPVKIKPNTDYVLSYASTISEVIVYFVQMDSECNKLKETSSKNKQHTFHSEATAEWVILKFTSIANNSYVVNNIQFEKGTIATAYEPYTGGKPSPSPEYPQEIKNSGKRNDEKQKYDVDVKAVGKNLFDVNYFTRNENYQNKDGDATYWKIAKMKVKPNTSYMLSKSKSVTVNGAINSVISYAGALGFNNNVNSVKVTTNDTGILYIMFFYRNEDVNILKELDIQVELGETLTEYEPYKEQTLTLALDQPLRGIGEMKDELSESGILRRVKSIALNGSEKWYKYENSAFVAMNCYGLKIDDLEVRNYSLTTLCNFFKWARFPQDIESQTAHGRYIYFTVPKETYPDLESFKEWLAKNTPVLEYWLKEPVLEELSEEDKASIRALKTYYPTTVITTDGGELDPDIKVTYRKEI